MRTRSLATVVIAALASAAFSLPAAAATKSYTRARVKTHSTETNCWTAVNGNVYNVTGWVMKHPGGPTVILAMCGKDATAAFKNMHGLKSRQATILSGFKVGTLSKAATPSKSATASASASATPSATSNALTAANVKTHNTSSSCWTIVDGNVYDITAWINLHPGGPTVIKGLCGIDGSAAFKGRHGSSGRAFNTLTSYKLGALAG